MGLTKDELAYRRYLESDDSDQYDITRERWAKLNWSLLDKCEQAISSLEKGESPNKISPLIISAGIGFDKLYSKRSEVSKPLSFPAPLLAMVRKGLKLRSPESVASTPRGEPLTGEVLTGETPSESLVSHGPDGGSTVPLTDPLVRQADPTQGGVAWAEPQEGERGHGATVSRQDSPSPEISETEKRACAQAQDVPVETPETVPIEVLAARAAARGRSTHPQTLRNPRTPEKTQADKDRRHVRKATREAMVQAVRKQVREEVPYRHPPKPGGII